MIFVWRGAGLAVMFAPIFSYFFIGFLQKSDILTLTTQEYAAAGLFLSAFVLPLVVYFLVRVKKHKISDDAFMLIPVLYWAPVALVVSILVYMGVLGNLNTPEWEMYFDSFMFQ